MVSPLNRNKKPYKYIHITMINENAISNKQQQARHENICRVDILLNKYKNHEEFFDNPFFW